MIICRTPYRISFFGGGTDYPVWYKENDGAVLATTIDKYCYISCRYLPPFFEHKYRVVYSKVEDVKSISQIEHPSVRATLQYMDIKNGVEIHHDGDLPARTGLGSSSSFTVGMLHSFYALKGLMPTKSRIAKEAIHIERDVLKENVGSQDQVLAAFGGFKKINFSGDDNFKLTPIVVTPSRLQELNDHIMLIFTGFSRFASDIAKSQIENIHKKKSELADMYSMVDVAIEILTSGRDIKDFGKLLHESWKLKRSLTDRISTSQIDDIYEVAHKAGAIGGKLLGAGGGGFVILFAEPDKQNMIKNSLKDFLHVPFKFEKSGSEIVFHSDSYEPLGDIEIQPVPAGKLIEAKEKAKTKIVEVGTKSKDTIPETGKILR
ncbi:MAG: kinase [Phycisphaerae bacterium]|nr:kinase [Phycisphaerae bacterium]